MTITPIDVADDATMSQMYAVVGACRQHDRPLFVRPPQAAVIEELRHADPGEKVHLWAIWDGDTMVGVLTAWLFLTDNLTTMWCLVDVHPEHRGRGHGTRGLQVLVDFARANGRTRMVTESHYPADRAEDHPFRMFAERRGFTLAQTEIIRRLELPVAPDLLAQLAHEARAAYQGRYRVESYEEVPPALRPSLCDCMNRLSTDAPSGQIDWEPESLDPQRYQGYLDLDARMGRGRLTAVAVEERSGQVVAYSELLLQPGTSRASQWGTLVRVGHRGHRLGLAVKVANLIALQARHPQRVDVTTGNAHDNPWMVSVNERLGFQPIELGPSFYRDLEPTA